MAAKKKTKSKARKLTSKRSVRRNAKPSKKPASKKLLKKSAVSRKKSRKKVTPGKPPVKANAVPKKTSVARANPPKSRRKSQTIAGLVFSSEGSRAGSAGQSGDLQGLSGIAGADSESVDELVEEGNAFEADVIAGVEEAGDEDEKEVRTHEVLEDDVPEEYLEKD